MDTIDTWLNTREPDSRKNTLLPIGEIVGEWKVVAFLGSGGSSEVYRVLSERGGKSAALKLLTSTAERNRARFELESELLRVQTLPCFARMINSGEWRGHPYLVMEELKPIELPVTEPAITAFILEICRAVASLHAEGYVHRDLKPGNIMRRNDGSLVLIDLGLVKKIERGEKPWLPRESLSIVDGGKVGVGTPGYSAPEQFMTGAANESSDVHGIGMLIWTCFNDNPPKRWVRVVEKATTSIPSQRFKSVMELMSAVETVSSVKPALVKLMLAVAYLPLIAVVIWMFARSFYLHYHYGEGARQIWNFIGQMIVLGVLESIIPIGLTFRKAWVRWLTIMIGGVLAFYLVMSFWSENGVQSLNGYALGSLILGFCPYIVVAGMLLIPRVARWYGRER